MQTTPYFGGIYEFTFSNPARAWTQKAKRKQVNKQAAAVEQLNKTSQLNGDFVQSRDGKTYYIVTDDAFGQHQQELTQVRIRAMQADLKTLTSMRFEPAVRLQTEATEVENYVCRTKNAQNTVKYDVVINDDTIISTRQEN